MGTHFFPGNNLLTGSAVDISTGAIVMDTSLYSLSVGEAWLDMREGWGEITIFSTGRLAMGSLIDKIFVNICLSSSVNGKIRIFSGSTRAGGFVTCVTSTVSDAGAETCSESGAGSTMTGAEMSVCISEASGCITSEVKQLAKGFSVEIGIGFVHPSGNDPVCDHICSGIHSATVEDARVLTCEGRRNPMVGDSPNNCQTSARVPSTVRCSPSSVVY